MCEEHTLLRPVEPKPNGRNLILCFDGTGNSFDETNTNIVKLYSMLERNDDHQLTYYQPGLGTYVAASFLTKPAKKIATMLDVACAIYLQDHVCGGYRFLQENYRPGDRIYLFGFSRGAYTARALAGMLNKVGLLAKDNIEQIPFAYDLYANHKNLDECRRFRRSFSRIVTVEFLGCWDTVSSVGYLYGTTLPYTRSNKMVRIFRHALAIDEHRAKFQPNYWQDPELTNQVVIDEYSYGGVFKNAVTWVKRNVFRIQPEKPAEPKPVEDDEYMALENTDIKEVWFAGCHADVGGGSTEDKDVKTLANPSLRWMVGEVLANCPDVKFLFDKHSLVMLGLYASLDEGPKALASTQNEDPLVKEMGELLKGDENLSVSLLTKHVAEARAKHEAVMKANPGGERSFTSKKDPKEIQNKTHDVFRQSEITDVLVTVHDSARNWKWWILEIIPLEYFYLSPRELDGACVYYLRRWFRANFFRGRRVPKKKVHFIHYSAFWRQKCKSLGYKYRCIFDDPPETMVTVYDAVGPAQRRKT